VTDPVWLSFAEVVELHDRVIARFGGSPGLRDEGLLRSALDRPRNVWSYEPDATLFRLAASLGFGLAKNHAFVDGNKRIAALAVAAFLFRNGYDLPLECDQMVDAYQQLASGARSESEFEAFVERHARVL
jgi:death-on-curing protein